MPVTFVIYSGPATVSGNTLSLTGEDGNVTVISRQEGNENYHPAPEVQQTFNVTSKKEQFITFDALPDRAVSDVPFETFAISSAGLQVSFEVVSGPAAINGNMITVSGVGTVVVRAIQEGNEEYLPATPVEQTFVVDHITGLYDEIKEANIKIFPNPIEGSLHIELDATRWDGATLYITNAIGEIVRKYIVQMEKFTIDLSGERSGLYLLHIQREQELYTSRFLKK